MTGLSFTVDAGERRWDVHHRCEREWVQSVCDYHQGTGIFCLAIFELAVGQTTGDSGFSTNGGDLSHMGLYGRTVERDTRSLPDPGLDAAAHGPGGRATQGFRRRRNR